MNLSRFGRIPFLFQIGRSGLYICFSLVALTQARAEEAKNPAPLPIEQMRAVVYTKAFAKRFALPDPESGTEPTGGIEAMEFVVEPGAKHTHGRYYCKLRLYLDSSLPIAYPEEGMAGSDRIFIYPAHFFLWPDPDNRRWLKLSEQDRLHFSERQSRYTRMTWLATPDYRWKPGGDISMREGFGVGMFYEEYHRDLFPGLAYLKIDMACPAYSSADKLNTVQVWLKREGGRDYRKQLREEPEDFLKFTLPPGFYRQIIQWTKQTAAYNRPLMEEQQRKAKRTKEHQ